MSEKLLSCLAYLGLCLFSIIYSLNGHPSALFAFLGGTVLLSQFKPKKRRVKGNLKYKGY